MMTNGESVRQILGSILFSTALAKPAGLRWAASAVLGVSGAAALAFPTLSLASAAVSAGALGVLYLSRQGGVPRGRSLTSGGHFLLGHDCVAGDEIRFDDDDLRRHFLVMGTPGMGRTAALVAFAADAIARNSGLLFVDAGADPDVRQRMRALAARHGRGDDFLVLDFRSSSKASSNAMNPFAQGRADALAEMLVDMTPWSEEGLWRGRGASLATGLLRALTALRDQGVMELDAGAVADHMELGRLMTLADTDAYPSLPASVRKSVSGYLSAIPGFISGKVGLQSPSALAYHEYLVSEFQKTLRPMAEDYGRVFGSQGADVSMSDVLDGRRILLVLLPTPGSRSDAGIPGKAVVAALKCALDSQTERRGVRHNGDGDVPPFVAVLDEAGRYAIDGMEHMTTRARSLNLGMVFAVGDMAGMKRLNGRDAGPLISNTGVKLIMRIDDPETANLAVDLAGRAYRPSGEVSAARRSDGRRRIEEVDRLKFEDMKSQAEGEMHVVRRGGIVRARTLRLDDLCGSVGSSTRAESFLGLTAFGG